MSVLEGSTQAELARALVEEILSRPADRRFDRDAERGVVNALRVRALRQELADSGCYSIDELARGRSSNPNAVHSWLRSAVNAHRLIKVANGNEVVVPAVLLDEAFDADPRWQPVLAALDDAGLDAWATWAWVTTPTGWLDDRTPAELIDIDPGLVADAARARADASQQHLTQRDR